MHSVPVNSPSHCYGSGALRVKWSRCFSANYFILTPLELCENQNETWCIVATVSKIILGCFTVPINSFCHTFIRLFYCSLILCVRFLYNFVITATLVVRFFFIFMKEHTVLVYGLRGFQANVMTSLSTYMLHHVLRQPLLCQFVILSHELLCDKHPLVFVQMLLDMFLNIQNVAAENKGFGYCLLGWHWHRT